MWCFKQVVKTAVTLSIVFGTNVWAGAHGGAPAQTVITNVNIFNGVDNKLATGQSVLIEGNHIKQVSPGLSAAGAEVIAGAIAR